MQLAITLRNIDQGALKRKNLATSYMAINIYVIKDNRKKPSNRSINNFRVLVVVKCSRLDKNLL